MPGSISTETGGSVYSEMVGSVWGEIIKLLIHFARPFSGEPTAPGVPYRTFAINDVSKVPAGEAVGRGTVEEGYTQLLLDLDEAEQKLPEGGADRANKGAAIALKSRIKLHKQDWAGVLTEAAKISDDYAVTANPATPFRGGTSSDNIFSFINSEGSNPNVNGALAAMYGNPADGGRGLVKISPLIWRADFWHADDTRRSGLTARNGAGIYTAKYIDHVTRTDPNPILRYAEVALNAAEASAHQGDLGAAVDLLNSVRSRALPASVPAFTVAGLGGEAGVLQAIYNERRIEFLAEGRRWADIHRLSGSGEMEGTPEKAISRSIKNIDFYTTDRAISTDYALEYDDYRFIWPIPLDEIQNNASAPIAQNPGY